MTTSLTTPRPWWKRAIRFCLWFFTSLFCLILFIASYSGKLEPSTFPVGSLLLLSYPLWLILTVLIAVIDGFACRRALLIVVLTFAACIPSLWNYSPFNVIPARADKDAGDSTFRFISYNVCAFHNFMNRFPGDVNPTVSFLLNCDADIINLQEVYAFSTSAGERVTSSQIDSLNHQFPYMLLNGNTQALLSKFPAVSIACDYQQRAGNEIAIFRADIYGTRVTIFDVHLQSYGLSDDDKNLYKELFRLDASDFSRINEIRHQLLDKIQTAAEQRAADAHRLGELINRFGGPNVIVAGDFNDVPGCYTLQYLDDFGLREVYPEVAFGPMISYNSDKFYFRIDHVLYRGALKPLSMHRGRVRSSDHYPVIVEFAVTSGSNAEN